MKRETLIDILHRAKGIEGKDASYQVQNGRRFDFFVGQPGQAMVITQARTIEVEPDFLHVRREDDASWYLAYDAVHAVVDRTGRDAGPRRAGFDS